MARYETITPGNYTDDQKVAAEAIAGSRGSVRGPFPVLLHNPKLAGLVEKFGTYARFDKSLPDRLNELAISICGRYWGAHVEWVAHSKLALDAGISQAALDALRDGTTPVFTEADEQAVHDFATGMLDRKQVDDGTYQRCLDVLGERGLIDLMATLTHYTMVSLTLNAFQMPVPAGSEPPFGPGR